MTIFPIVCRMIDQTNMYAAFVKSRMLLHISSNGLRPSVYYIRMTGILRALTDRVPNGDQELQDA